LNTPRTNIAVQPLSLSLYQRSVHPELFNIYRQFDFSSKRFSATLWITDQCHVLTVSAESTHVTELIATPNQPLPASALLAKFQLPSQKDHTHVFGNSLKYSCKFGLAKSTLAQQKKLHTLLKHCTGKDSMLIDLPELSTDARPAFTYIQTHCERDKLNILTRHSRPDRPDIITTNTTIDLSQIR
jgi:hypothetical protein